MAIELNLTRSDKGIPWGFRLTGGAEYDLPIIVTKVVPNSIAAAEGLQEEDIIVRINDTPTAGLLHPQCHDLLVAAGNNLILAIRRGDVSDLYPHFAKGDYELLNTESVEDDEISTSYATTVSIDEAHQQPREMMVEDLSDSHTTTTEQRSPELVNVVKEVKTKQNKWSTFLQKPENHLPAKRIEPEKPKETYRVVIQKQKKKKKFPFSTEEKTEEVEAQVQEENIGNVEENNNIVEQKDEEAREEQEAREIEDEQPLSQNENESIEENPEQQESNRGFNEIVEENPNTDSEIPEEPAEKTLEEQLAEVQRQLLALAQMPTAIQDTLEAVTKQLAKIVSAKQGPDDGPEEQEEEEKVEEYEENLSCVENTHTENDITEQQMSEGGSVVNEDETARESLQYDENENLEQSPEQHEQDEQDEQEETINDEPELTEEEREALRREQELNEKREKEEQFIQCRLKQRPTQALKPKPLERPIILPGGRRWSGPDDACPVVKQRKMTDEKIAQTIETFSEVISGKLKGINFLKYQPPPKNLDYLQKSEVYRLVHDMEPSVKGIGSRNEKILAAEDYYATQ